MQQEPGSRIADTVGEVAERVREVIGRAGCSQREFARRIVMDPSKLSRSLSGSRRFTIAELARVADAGQVDAGWLLGSGAAAPVAPVRVAPATEPAAPGATGTAAITTAAATALATAPVTGTMGAAPGGGRPLQIVRETVRLIARHGFHAVRVSDIAEACATSTAAIHYHFPGRAELLEAAVRWCMDEDTARRSARIAESGNALDEMCQLIELQTPATERQRQQWLVWLDMWAEAARSTAIGRLHVDYYRQWRTTVADVIRRGITQGVFREVDPEFSALRLTALIDGLAAQVLATTPAGTSTVNSPASGPDPGPGKGPGASTSADASGPASSTPVSSGPASSSPGGGGSGRSAAPPGNGMADGLGSRPGNVPGDGTTAEDMRTALLAYVDTELSAHPASPAPNA